MVFRFEDGALKNSPVDYFSERARWRVGMGKAAVIGGISGAISFGIGESVTGMSNFVAKAGLQAGMHGIKSGIMTSIEGGSFMSGFAAGAVSSLISSSVEGLGHSGGYYIDDDYTQWTSFGARNPNLLKAMMISSGGLSGGISSSIAGGNFWSGAREGLITSGLNHAMHNCVLAYVKHRFQVEIDRAFGEMADDIIPYEKRTCDELYQVVKKVPILRKIYNSFGRKITLSARADRDTSASNADAHVRSESHRIDPLVPYDDPMIIIYGSSFQSYRYLAETILHEFGHVKSILSGNFLKTYNEMAKRFKDKTTVWNQTIYHDEIFAYKFAFQHGGVPYEYTYGYQKAQNSIIR